MKNLRKNKSRTFAFVILLLYFDLKQNVNDVRIARSERFATLTISVRNNVESWGSDGFWRRTFQRSVIFTQYNFLFF